jgi:pimeloyl-ACP methyl ester carboxylesterase
MACSVRMTASTTVDPPPVLERHISAGGIDVRLREAGQGSPLLLFHGFGDSCATWAAVLPRLARHHRVIAPDLPGFGGSGPLPEGPMLDVLVGAVADLREALGIRGPAAVIGNSMGGAVALRLALDRPDLVSRLVLVDAAGLAVGVPLWWRLLSVQLAPISAALAVGAGRLPGGLVERTAARIYPRLTFHDATACSAETRAAFARHYRGADDVRRLTAHGPRLVRSLADGRLLRDAVRLRQPLLVVWGRNDRLIPVGDGVRVTRAVVDGRLCVIDECGHCPQLERPDDFLAAVEPFLRARAAGRPAASDDGEAESLPA